MGRTQTTSSVLRIRVHCVVWRATKIDELPTERCGRGETAAIGRAVPISLVLQS